MNGSGLVRRAAAAPDREGRGVGLPTAAGELDPDGDLHRRMAVLLPELRGFARSLTREAVAADDLVQDTLVRALAARQQFQPDTNLKAWLFTIQRNAFYEQIRRRRRESRVLSERMPDAASALPDAALRGELSDLQRLLFTLPPLLREALVLVGAQELSYEQAAAICAVPVGTVKARVSRARTQLARAMAGSDTASSS